MKKFENLWNLKEFTFNLTYVKVFNANFPFKAFKANFLGPIVVKGSEVVQVPLNLKVLNSY